MLLLLRLTTSGRQASATTSPKRDERLLSLLTQADFDSHVTGPFCFKGAGYYYDDDDYYDDYYYYCHPSPKHRYAQMESIVNLFQYI